MTTDPRGSTSLSRLPSLTGLRFVAVLFVFAFHASLEAPSRTPASAGDTRTPWPTPAGWA